MKYLHWALEWGGWDIFCNLCCDQARNMAFKLKLCRIWIEYFKQNLKLSLFVCGTF